MLDRAPVLFGPGRDFLHVGDQSVKAPAVSAVQLFDSVEIVQLPQIQSDIAASLYLWGSVDTETDKLENGYDQIEEKGGALDMPK